MTEAQASRTEAQASRTEANRTEAEASRPCRMPTRTNPRNPPTDSSTSTATPTCLTTTGPHVNPALSRHLVFETEVTNRTSPEAEAGTFRVGEVEVAVFWECRLRVSQW